MACGKQTCLFNIITPADYIDLRVLSYNQPEYAIVGYATMTYEMKLRMLCNMNPM